MEEYKEQAANEIDVMEDSILKYDPSVLRLLLQDKTTKRNIIWATSDYEALGTGYEEWSEITPELITGENTLLIQPRSAKAIEEQSARTRDKAEVFTPSWVCNSQNNLIDTEWFGRENVFNRETYGGWVTTNEPVDFSGVDRDWTKYVDAQRLEITCGEAPYLVSRYDTVTGVYIPTHNRIGLLDRKMRIVEENTEERDDWIVWSLRALQSVFGYEYQGDNLLLARENLLFSYIDYYHEHFHDDPDVGLLRKVANIIAWNIWQMDGLKYVVPNSCHDVEAIQLNLFGTPEPPQPCPGCKQGDPFKHTGIYCVIQDWRTKEPVRFIDMMKGWK